MATPKPVTCTIVSDIVQTEDSDLARELYNQGRYGTIAEKKVQLSFLEAYFLLHKGRIRVKDKAGKKLSEELFLRRAQRKEKQFWIKSCVFKDLRERGYIVKTALKFGADFRVYDRGIKPGEDHAKWIVYPVHETENMTMHEFAAKNRVAHSTKKRLLLAIVDEENECIFYEIKWIRP